MSVYEVPLSPAAQVLAISIAGVAYNLRVVYADAPDGDGGWLLDISDGDSNAILAGVPLVTGVDLLGQYASLGIPGRWYVVSDGVPAAAPAFANLGVASHLYVEV